ncbi:hypothetical protein [Prevotella sp. HCN-7019]|jgi:hypothetical protein|uniref:hypothetical protein n=1 Tax=Prevotella sp. HCN-7019 TaxID=3134668 RepID=UPI0026200BC3
MNQYGYMEGAYLRSRYIEPKVIKEKDADGKIQTRTVSVDEQVAELPYGWKRVDAIDEASMQTVEDYMCIVPVPYDAGDHIAYKYEKRFDEQRVREEINREKSLLAGSDYKVIKCYEASLTGGNQPYDIVELQRERQAFRDRINRLESLLTVNNKE